MEYDIIYPEERGLIRNVPCVIAASYFYPDKLVSFGVKPTAYEVSDPYADINEFEKIFKLWESPIYLRNFFSTNKEYFKQEYWGEITEDKFVYDVLNSTNQIQRELIKLFSNHSFHTIVEPLTFEERDLRLYTSIRIKAKKGQIHGRYAFRFYAIEIEENKCYLITGATIKIHKDMGKAPNTMVEKNKLEFALNELRSHNVDTKDLFIDLYLESN